MTMMTLRGSLGQAIAVEVLWTRQLLNHGKIFSTFGQQTD